MTPAVKLLCVYLADHMTADRHVSVPRAVIAQGLGIHEQRVAERLKKAVNAGFLTHVRIGHVGRTAEYQGARPDQMEERKRTAPQDASKTRLAVRTIEAEPTNGAGKRTALQDANKRAPFNGWVETEQREPPDWLDSDDAAEEARSVS